MGQRIRPFDGGDVLSRGSKRPVLVLICHVPVRDASKSEGLESATTFVTMQDATSHRRAPSGLFPRTAKPREPGDREWRVRYPSRRFLSCQSRFARFGHRSACPDQFSHRLNRFCLGLTLEEIRLNLYGESLHGHGSDPACRKLAALITMR